MTKRHIRLLAATLYHRVGETLEVVESEAAVRAAPQHKILMAHAEKLVQRGEAEWLGVAGRPDDGRTGTGSPAAPESRSTGGPASQPRKRTGPPPVKFNAVIDALVADLRSGKLTLQQLETMFDKELEGGYGAIAGRDTLRRARTAVLEMELRQTSVKNLSPTNFDK